jgi:hypothetical protein
MNWTARTKLLAEAKGFSVLHPDSYSVGVRGYFLRANTVIS